MSSPDFSVSDDSDDKRGGIRGGLSKRASRGSGKAPNYLESSEDDVANSDSESDEVHIRAPTKKSSQKRVSPNVKNSVVQSLSDDDSDMKDEHVGQAKPPKQNLDGDGAKPSAVAKPASVGNKDISSNTNKEGIDVLIPHSLLNKHQGAGKGECTMLVQVDGDDHQLDFHGQSGAVGRFEADGEGVTLDLKGFQYRGTIRPGPTAMVIALTRDNQFKIEAITDEFVTLDTERTNMMDKFDAVVEGEMDDSYKVKADDNVNHKVKKAKHDEESGDEEKGTKRKNAAKDAKAGPAKKRKIAAKK
ncbi:hypothetical protein ACHAXN_001842 [Cyclotella atomus]